MILNFKEFIKNFIFQLWTHTYDFDKDYWLNSAKQGKLIKWCESHDKINWKKFMYSLEYVR